MLTQRGVIKGIELLKRKCELIGAGAKSTMNINKPITSEEDGFDPK
jgi:hypothetical protein